MPVQYKQFRIGELFNLDRTRKTLNAQDLTIYEAADDGLYPYVVRQSRNNGIKGYVFVENQEWLNPGNTISFAQDTAEMFYQSNPYVTGNNMRVMTIQGHDLTEEIALFLISALRKTFSSYSWGMSFRKEVLDNEKISLPVTPSGIPDWDYMQEYISELEQERVSELEKYLAATGLDDYELTDDDREVLEISGFRRDENGKPVGSAGGRKEMREFRVGDVLNIDSTKGVYHACNVVIEDKHTSENHPYVVRTSQNNGLRGYIKVDESTLNPGNTISFAQDTAQMFYQSEPYFTGNKVKVMSIKGYDMTEDIALALIACLNRAFAMFGWGQSYDVSILRNVMISLPVTSAGVPDWDFMSRYIRAIEKMVVKDVVDYKDEFIARTKAVVS